MNQKGFAPIIGIIGLLVIIIGVGSYSFLINQGKTSQESTRVSVSKPKFADLIDAVKLSLIFAQFKNKTFEEGKLIEVVNNQKRVVSDKFVFAKDLQTGYSFYYPQNMFIRLHFEDYKDPNGVQMRYLGIELTDKESDLESIDYLIKCEHDNRVEPAGICAEGFPSYLSGSIAGTDADKEKLVQEAKERNSSYAEAYTIEEINGLITYTQITRNLDGSPGYVYKVIAPKLGRKYVLQFTTATDIIKSDNYKLALWVILNSFDVLKK